MLADQMWYKCAGKFSSRSRMLVMLFFVLLLLLSSFLSFSFDGGADLKCPTCNATSSQVQGWSVGPAGGCFKETYQDHESIIYLEWHTTNDHMHC